MKYCSYFVSVVFERARAMCTRSALLIAAPQAQASFLLAKPLSYCTLSIFLSLVKWQLGGQTDMI